LRKKIFALLEEKKVGVIIEASEREYGTIRVYSGGSYKMSEEPGLPDLVISNEQYGRIYRILKKNLPVTLEVNTKNTFFETDTIAFNVIAEIPGTDRKLEDEIVMLGAHLDSWHPGTGATDNAGNCAVVMEAMRILKALDVKPRRTIRMALWSGEEQGYLGSRGYLEKHYGDRTTMTLKEAHKDFSVYFNLDNGNGKIRGIYLQENDAARPIFEAWLKPFNDMDATVVSIQNTSGTDHIPFNEIGLPGFQFIQDPIDYMSRTHHTNMDVYEHIIAGDAMQSAVILATFVYHAAMRDKKIPRKTLPEPKPKDPWD
jgi:Zn-dependent M28 family amino/carboxypeptidase